MRKGDARAAALKILLRVEREGSYASVLLREMETDAWPIRDAALATEITYGVLRHRLVLDRAIAAASARPLERIDQDLLMILRIGAYQLLHLDRVPAHAAVDEAVRLARSARRRAPRAAAAFVNGVLRGLSRAGGAGDDAGPEDPVAAMALEHSHPGWMVSRWVERFGIDATRSLLVAANSPAPLALRVLRQRVEPAALEDLLAAEGVSVRRSRLLDEYLIVEKGVPHRTRAFRDGLFYIQDEASGLVSRLLGDPGLRGGRVLDACAAPGGKAIALLETVGPGGFVLAADRHLSRLRLLRDNLARLGLSGCSAVVADMTGALPVLEDKDFDAVLIDAPCSGTGVIRRHPELRYRLRPEDLERLAVLQSDLLDACAPRVRGGGALVYAVCSLEAEEGIENARRFISRTGAALGFRPRDPSGLLPDVAKGMIRSHDDMPCLVTRPDLHALDGFFAIRFDRMS